MELQYKIDLLCFLTEAKANKPFYKAHKPDIDFFIKVLKDSIGSDPNNLKKLKKKIGFTEISPFIVPILQLIAAYLHNTS
jgi:hypothetical protein